MPSKLLISSLSRTLAHFLLCFSALVVLILATACSRNQLPDNLQANLQTRINESGLKHFKLTIPLIVDSKEIRAKRLEQSTQSKRDLIEKQARYIDKLLYAEAERKIIASGFCREGYWIIDSNAYGKPPYLRGECNEPANAQDRQTFPNTFSQW